MARLYLSGLGDGAQCPSAEQLQGIIDVNDPCQNQVLSAISPSVSQSTASALNQPSLSASEYLALPSGGSSVSMTTILIGVGVLVGIMALAGGKR